MSFFDAFPKPPDLLPDDLFYEGGQLTWICLILAARDLSDNYILV